MMIAATPALIVLLVRRLRRLFTVFLTHCSLSHFFCIAHTHAHIHAFFSSSNFLAEGAHLHGFFQDRSPFHRRSVYLALWFDFVYLFDCFFVCLLVYPFRLSLSLGLRIFTRFVSCCNVRWIHPLMSHFGNWGG